MNKLFNNDITLHRDSHTYQLLDDSNMNFKSVTTCIGVFFEEFDVFHEQSQNKHILYKNILFIKNKPPQFRFTLGNGGKPYPCIYCTKSFSVTGSLNKHM